MKDSIKFDTNTLNKEEKLQLNLSVSQFDIKTSYLTDKEDIDDKFIKYIEREIRNSFEYKNYIQYLKEELDLTKCSLLPNIDIKTTPVSLEFHHFPFTLYDITKIIASAMLEESVDKSVSCFDIAEQVVLEHYKGIIGLVPLTETMHQMAHSGSIIIPFDKINGGYNLFIKKYIKHIDPAQVEKIQGMKIFAESDEAKIYNKQKLTKRIVNYEITYKKEEDENV